MNQFLYTICTKEESITGNAGQQVRAKSEALSANEAYAFTKYAGYMPPLDYKDDDGGNKFPIRYTRVTTTNKEILFIHSKWLGVYQGRSGSFISHVLVPGKGDNFDSLDFLNLWDDPFWIKSNPRGDFNILPPPDSPVSSLDRNALFKFLAALPERRHYLEFLIRAYLSLGEYQKVFIACPPDEAIWWCYGLIACLPRTHARSLTFSTFESNPANSFVKVACTTWLTESRDLPQTHYTTAGYGLNTFNKRSEPEPQNCAYATKAAEIAADPQRHMELDEFLDSTESIAITGPGKLDILWHAFKSIKTGSAGYVDRINAILSDPELAAWPLNQQRFRVKIFQSAYKHAQTQQNLRNALAVPSPVTQDYLYEELVRLIKEEDYYSIPKLLFIAGQSPDTITALRQRLWNNRAEWLENRKPASFKPGLRKLLAEEFAKITGDFDDLLAWLIPPDENQQVILDYGIPDGLKVRTLYYLLESETWKSSLVKRIIKDEDLRRTILDKAYNAGQSIFLRAAGYFPGAQGSLIPLLFYEGRCTPQIDDPVYHQLLNIAFEDDNPEKVIDKFGDRWTILWKLADDGNLDWNKLVRNFIRHADAHALDKPVFKKILGDMAEVPQLDTYNRADIQKWHEFINKLRKPESIDGLLELATDWLKIHNVLGDDSIIEPLARSWTKNFKPLSWGRNDQKFKKLEKILNIPYYEIVRIFLSVLSESNYNIIWGADFACGYLSELREDKNADKHLVLGPYFNRLSHQSQNKLHKLVCNERGRAEDWIRWQHITGRHDTPKTLIRRFRDFFGYIFSSSRPISIQEVLLFILIIICLSLGMAVLGDMTKSTNHDTTTSNNSQSEITDNSN